jgi:hypothetical protein
LTIGGVLVSPFVIYAAAAIAIFAVLRPLLHLVASDRALSGREIEPLRPDPRAADRAFLEGEVHAIAGLHLTRSNDFQHRGG